MKEFGDGMANEGSETSMSTRRTRVHPLIVILPFIALFIVILLVSVIVLPEFGSSLTTMIPLDDLIKLGTLILIIIIIVIIFIPTVGTRGTSIDQPLPAPRSASGSTTASESDTTTGTTEKRMVDAEIVEEKRTKPAADAASGAVNAEKKAPVGSERKQQPAPPSEPTVVNWPRDVSDGVYGDTLLEVGKKLKLRLRTLLIDFRTLRKM